MRILLVAVNYNSTEQALSFLKRCIGSKGTNVYVVMVDNSARPSGELASHVEQNSETQFYHAANENLGYLNGLGRGVAVGMARWGEFDWTVLCNVDLVLEMSGLKDQLARHVSDPSIGVVGPSIVSALSKRDQNPFLVQRPSIERVRAWRFIYRYPWLGMLYQFGSDLIRQRLSSSYRHAAVNNLRAVYAVHGSIFALSAAFLARAGSLHWPCFLFGEELWFAEKARELGLKVVYDPSIVVQHQEHITTKKLSSASKMRLHCDSMSWLIEQHWNSR
jgi:GT2 family glycosyltransferase